MQSVADRGGLVGNHRHRSGYGSVAGGAPSRKLAASVDDGRGLDGDGNRGWWLAVRVGMSVLLGMWMGGGAGEAASGGRVGDTVGDTVSEAVGGVSPSRPNVVLIMADDIGWECFGAYGGQDYKTPRLDALCRAGVQMTHCYSTPLCTPSRVQIMTGKYNFRNYTHFGFLSPNERTFGQMMREQGYATAIAGKWQLNGLANLLPGWDDTTRPHHFGFDEYLLWQLTREKQVERGGGERYWSPLLERSGELLTIEANDGLYGPDLMCDFVCDFISRHRDDPFFVYYPMLLVHDPFVPTPDSIGDGSRGHEANDPDKSRRQEHFAAMVEYLDKIVGRIVDHLESLGQLENTLILFTADNGTHASITSGWNGRSITGGKGGSTDMGTHVPLIAFWKGKTPVGHVCSDLVDFTDFYPTLAELVGGEATGCDGQSFLPQLLGATGSPRSWVLCHYQPFWHREPRQFARNHRYKLYPDGQLFDVPADLAEQRPLATEDLDTEVLGVRDDLQRLLDRLPPLPPGMQNRESIDRPTYPDWPVINPAGAVVEESERYRVDFDLSRLP
jgi:arylsulfatase A